MIGVLVALALPALAVWWVLRLARVGMVERAPVLGGAVAFLLGVGGSSLTTFAALSAGRVSTGVFVGLDAVLWGGLATLAWLAGRSRRSMSPPAASDALRAAAAPSATLPLARLAFAVVAGLSLSVPIVEYLRSPHGQWDAWAIWNQKARFMYRAGDGWTASLMITWSAPSHPLLVSASVARLWSYAGSELTVAPALLSGVFGASVVATVVGLLDPRRAHAWVAGALVAAPFSFSHLVAAQTADLPCGAFMAASFASLACLKREQGGPEAHRSGTLVVAGLLGGLSAWTKNEGLAFVVVGTCVAAWATWRGGRLQNLAWWLAGVAPGVLLIAWFKVALVPAQLEYAPGSPSDALALLLSPVRHQQVWAQMRPHLLAFGGPLAGWSLPLVMVAAVAAAGRVSVARAALGVAASMMVGYYVVYLVSPVDLPWLVATTFERLTMQVWPLLAVAACSSETFGGPASSRTPDPREA
jgi:hypothetical protein